MGSTGKKNEVQKKKQKRKYSLGGKEAQLPFIKVKEIQKYKYCEGGRAAQLT